MLPGVFERLDHFRRHVWQSANCGSRSRKALIAPFDGLRILLLGHFGNTEVSDFEVLKKRTSKGYNVTGLQVAMNDARMMRRGQSPCQSVEQIRRHQRVHKPHVFAQDTAEIFSAD